jgi:uncharacterized delta-60 repeat protein
MKKQGSAVSIVTTMAVLFFGLCLMPAAASATPGDLDASFAAGGLLGNVFGVQGGGSFSDALVIQPDGKYIVGGSDYATGMALARYNPDGSPDLGFGVGGQVRTSITSYSEVNAIALKPDGKIVAVGNTKPPIYDFAVAVYNPDGSPDNSFSGDGKLQTDFSGDSDLAFAAVVQPDGMIVVAGTAKIGGDYDFAMARYKTDGSLDTTGFGGGGKASSIVGSKDDSISGITLLPDGKFLVGGTAGYIGGNNSRFAVARYSSAGVLDNSFDGDGRNTMIVGANAVADAAVMQSDGKMLLAGYSSGTNPSGFALGRFNADGSPDAGFGNGGSVVSSVIGSNSNAKALALQPDGKIIAGGYTNPGGSLYQAVLARYGSDGAFDPAFGGGGYVLTSPTNNDDELRSLAIQSDGKIVAASISSTAGGNDTGMLLRYLDRDPSPETFALTAGFSKSLKSKMKASKLKSISGTAAGTGLAQVQISLNLANKSLLKEHKRCLFVKSTSGATKKYKSKGKKCPPAKWLTATGTTNWSLKLKKKLKPGKYTIYVRALDAAGTTQTSFTKQLGNLKTVTVAK